MTAIVATRAFLGAQTSWACRASASQTARPVEIQPKSGEPPFPGCRYFEYDTWARVLARVEPSEARPLRRAFEHRCPVSVLQRWDGTLRARGRGALARAALERGIRRRPLRLLPRRDERTRDVPGARYLLDTVKGADLGTNRSLLVLDFNFAYNSCAYDSSWACPLAPPESRLSVSVRAGEGAPRDSQS
jgi:uncharacterized protein (DUF1684 family)